MHGIAKETFVVEFVCFRNHSDLFFTELLCLSRYIGVFGPEGEKQYRVQVGEFCRCLQETFRQRCCV